MHDSGEVLSNTIFSSDWDIVHVRNLIWSFPVTFGAYKRVVYFIDFKLVWDYKVDPDIFNEFLEQLFAVDYHSPMYTSDDFNYHNWGDSPQFLQDNYILTEKEKLEIRDDDLPI
ncbi:hypothetical protein OH784_29940 [Ectobacillus funiculus]|uniref:hypothetical protein n=1 Tax=Ectobacillus funiculus TaxID=137993 RepID=UPI003978567E